MEEINIIDLLYLVKKKLWLIILLCSIGCGLAYYWTDHTEVPTYYTQAKLMLGKPENSVTEAINTSEIALNRTLIKTYASIAKTDLVLEDVKEALPFNVSTNYLKSVINLSLVNETEIISVSTVGTNPEYMTTIVNTFVDVFAVRIAEIMKIDNVVVLEKAKVPYYPFPSSMKKNVVLGGGAGFALALFIIFLIEMFDDTIKVPEDITKHLGLPVLGMIPEHK